MGYAQKQTLHEVSQECWQFFVTILIVAAWLVLGAKPEAHARTCPCSIWNNTPTPTVVQENDPKAVELGLKFQASVNGSITGIRFYKGRKNTGPHVGHLWTNSGTLLASVSFTNETATGWQQATLATPVAITANTTYVVSYYAPAGWYAVLYHGSGHYSTAGAGGWRLGGQWRL